MKPKSFHIPFSSKTTYEKFKKSAKVNGLILPVAITEAMEMWIEKNKRGYSKKKCIPNEIQESEHVQEPPDEDGVFGSDFDEPYAAEMSSISCKPTQVEQTLMMMNKVTGMREEIEMLREKSAEQKKRIAELEKEIAILKRVCHGASQDRN